MFSQVTIEIVLLLLAKEIGGNSFLASSDSSIEEDHTPPEYSSSSSHSPDMDTNNITDSVTSLPSKSTPVFEFHLLERAKSVGELDLVTTTNYGNISEPDDFHDNKEISVSYVNVNEYHEGIRASNEDEAIIISTMSVPSTVIPTELVTENVISNPGYAEILQDIFVLKEYQNNSVHNFTNTVDVNDGEKAINTTEQLLNLLQSVMEQFNDTGSVPESENITNIPDLQQLNLSINETKVTLSALEGLHNLSLRINLLGDLFDKNKKISELYNNKDYDIDLLYDSINGKKEEIDFLTRYIAYAEEVRQYLQTNNLNYILDKDLVRWLLNTEQWSKTLDEFNENLVFKENVLELHTKIDFLDEVVTPAMMGTVFIVGMFGNGLLLLIFIRHKEMRTSPNLLLINLAFGEFLSLCVSIPTAYLYNLTSYGNTSSLSCKSYAFFRFQGIAVSSYSLVAVSIQRYFAITSFFEKKGFKIGRKTKSVLLLSFIWIFGSCVSIPNTILAGTKNEFCFADTNKDYSRFTTIWNVMTLCFIPVLLNTTFSTITVSRLRQSAKQMPGEHIGQGKVKRTRMLSSNVIVVLIVVFACCYSPYFLFIFLYTWFRLVIEELTYRYILSVSYLLIFINSCLNPIALYIVSQRYRNYFNKYLFCFKNIKFGKSSSEESTATVTSQLDTRV